MILMKQNRYAPVFETDVRESLHISRKRLAEAAEYFERGDYARSFLLFSRSVEAGSRAGRAGDRIRPADTGLVYDQSEALNELLFAVGPDDEKLDILYDFLTDSGRKTAEAQGRRQVFLYRRMVLEHIAGIGCRPLAQESVATSEMPKGSATPDALEERLNFGFALSAYLETFIAYQRWCLDFEENSQPRMRRSLVAGRSVPACAKA